MAEALRGRGEQDHILRQRIELDDPALEGHSASVSTPARNALLATRRQHPLPTAAGSLRISGHGGHLDRRMADTGIGRWRTPRSASRTPGSGIADTRKWGADGWRVETGGGG